MPRIVGLVRRVLGVRAANPPVDVTEASPPERVQSDDVYAKWGLADGLSKAEHAAAEEARLSLIHI